MNHKSKHRALYYGIVFLFSFLLYGNSINNQYSLDDEIVTLHNSRVEKGIKGIPEIFTTYYSVESKARYEYRPIVLTTFALEYEIFGRNPHVSHFFNVMTYALTCTLLFYLLQQLFLGYSFFFLLFALLLFTAHPLHTEIVNNLKSRDELLALFFSLFSLAFSLRFYDTFKWKFLAFAFVLLLAGILSKRNAIIFVILIPLILYFFKTLQWKKILFVALPLGGTILAAMLLRGWLVKDETIREFLFFENPLFFETSIIKRIAPGLYTLWYYLELLVFPHRLSFYYGFNQVPIPGWNHPKVWLSLLFHCAILFHALKTFRQRHILSFAILFYLITLFPFSNIHMPMVGIVAERFTYMASIGFTLALSFLIFKIFNLPVQQISNSKYTPANNILYIKNNYPFFLFCFVILALYSIRVITRNPDWKDHLTLYRHDIKHLDNSAKAHAMISNTLYPQLFKMPKGVQKNALILECIQHYKKTLEIYPDYITSNNNLGSILFTFMGDYTNAAYYYRRAVALDSTYVEAHYNLGFSYEKLGRADSAIYYFEKTLRLDPQYRLAYERMNKLYYKLGLYEKGVEIHVRAAAGIPQGSAMYFLNAANMYSALNDTLHALEFFSKALEKNPQDKRLRDHIARIHRQLNQPEKAKEYVGAKQRQEL